jgi:hypothetical protein
MSCQQLCSQTARVPAWPADARLTASNQIDHSRLHHAALLHRNVRCSSSKSGSSSGSSDVQREHHLRMRLGRQFPNAVVSLMVKA